MSASEYTQETDDQKDESVYISDDEEETSDNLNEANVDDMEPEKNLDNSDNENTEDEPESTYDRSFANMLMLNQIVGSPNPSLLVDNEYYYDELTCGITDEHIMVHVVITGGLDPDNPADLIVYINDAYDLKLTVAQDNNPIEASALFADSCVSITADSYESATLNAYGSAQLTKYNGSFSLGITLNDSPLIQSTCEISGNGTGSITVNATDVGFLIEGGNLSDITVSAKDEAKTYETTFSNR